jgi:hypothetical protein
VKKPVGSYVKKPEGSYVKKPVGSYVTKLMWDFLSLLGAAREGEIRSIQVKTNCSRGVDARSNGLRLWPYALGNLSLLLVYIFLRIL